jgi:hypothetical protein
LVSFAADAADPQRCRKRNALLMRAQEGNLQAARELREWITLTREYEGELPEDMVRPNRSPRGRGDEARGLAQLPPVLFASHIRAGEVV